LNSRKEGVEDWVAKKADEETAKGNQEKRIDGKTEKTDDKADNVSRTGHARIVIGGKKEKERGIWLRTTSVFGGDSQGSRSCLGGESMRKKIGGG